ncbi:MAG: transposase [Chlorobaculum sp.]|nr:transposase [Chlorobaculum sp.]
MMNRHSFSSDLKAKVALEAIHSLKTLNEIAREFGVHPVQVGNWKKELQEQAASLFEVKRGPKALDRRRIRESSTRKSDDSRLSWTG